MSSPFDAYSRGDGTERLAAFSDGVFAISVTLLVLDVRLPEGSAPLSEVGLAQALWAVAPRVYAYALSFLVVGQYWIGHHHALRWIQRFDNGLLWWNLFYLLAIAFIPFPTSVLASHPDNTVSAAFYVSTLALVGVFSFGLWHHAVAHRLVAATADPTLIRYVRWRIVTSTAILLVAIPVAFVSPDAAPLSGLFIPAAMLLLSRRLRGRQPARVPGPCPRPAPPDASRPEP
jgi:uncharacterized membrane protein